MKVENGILVSVNDSDVAEINKNKKIWDGITAIGDRAFHNCENLTNITIPDSVTEIKKGVFDGCTNLKNITIPNSVKVIGEYAFYNCESLTNITIPDSVTEIGIQAFDGCTNLKNITIPNSVKVIGDGAFYKCENLTKITIPNSVKVIGEDAFYKCESLTNIIIPDSVTEIKKGVFWRCTNLTNITIPNSVKVIGEYAFGDCKNLINITIPDSVTEIGIQAFDGCTNLKNITIPNSVKVIGEYAFYNCESLTNIIIPDSILSIGRNLYNGVNTIICNGKSLDLHCEVLRSMVSQGRIKKIFENITQKQINKIIKLIESNNSVDMAINLYDYCNLCSVLGAFEDKDKTIKLSGKEITVKDVAYTFLQGLQNRGELDFKSMHRNFQGLQFQGFNEEFLKFCLNKTNWNDVCQEPELLPRIYEWYLEREKIDLQEELSNDELPHTEENRYRLLVYKTMQNGVDKIKWLRPTVELFKKEFANKKFSGLTTARDHEIAQEIDKHNIYEQKHFDKAKEIDEEREAKGIENVLKTKVSQGRIASLDEYREKTQSLSNHILDTSKEILAQEKEDTSHIFTYEVLDKSDPVNFAIGCYTSCCARLYGAGAGAMRAMIIHPDIQPLAIKDFNGNIVSFGIIYVNREEGYAVVNDFEVNISYDESDSQRRSIYEKAVEGVEAFVKEYNIENSAKPIRKVTCGCSPNWTAINDYIRENPKSEILKAPNFDDYKYAGSGSWSGDWHKEQYVLWEEEEDEFSR